MGIERIQAPNGSKTFAVGDVVSLGPGGQHGTVQRIHVLCGLAESLDLLMHNGREAWPMFSVSPRFLVVVQKAED